MFNLSPICCIFPSFHLSRGYTPPFFFFIDYNKYMRIVRFSRCRMISAFHISFIQQQQKLALESWPTPLALLLFENNFTFILVSTCLASSEQWRNIALPWILTLPVSPVFPNAKAIHVCDLATRTCPFSPVGILYLYKYFFLCLSFDGERRPWGSSYKRARISCYQNRLSICFT